MSKEIQNQGAWIFLSHSHKDLEEVRFVRNAFEEMGHNPLMFFLKCLDDDSELDDLIRREIEARSWFVLCNSDNAKDSKWVQKEIEMIKSLKGKVFDTINLDEDPNKQLELIEEFSKRVTVFISYHLADREIAQKISDILTDNDFGVYDSQLLYSSQDRRNAIDLSVKKGFFLVLLSPKALGAREINLEIRAALKKLNEEINEWKTSSIIPISLINPNEISKYLATYELWTHKFWDFSRGDMDENMAKLIEFLKFGAT